MTAAAELIAELGWGRVTTRAVAERAGLPHGAVSYHFAGKQELLTDAALNTFERAIPPERFAALATIDDLLTVIAAQLEVHDAPDSLLSRLMLEAMREAERDAALRERLGGMLVHYRGLIVEMLRTEQQRGVLAEGVSPEAIAVLLSAVGDGLFLHALLDPALDVAAAIDALRELLAARR